MSNPFGQQIIALGCMFFVGVHVERGDFINEPLQWFGLVIGIALGLLIAADAKRAAP